METVQSSEPITITMEIQAAVRHGTVYGVANMVMKVVGFLMLPFYTHYLNPADYGIMEILDLSMTLFGMFLNMGLTMAVLRRHAAAHSAEERRAIISTAFLFVTISGTVIFLLGLGFYRPLSVFLLGPNVPPLFLLLSFSSFVLLYVSSVPGIYLRALEYSGTVFVIQCFGTLITLSLNVYFIAVMKIGLLGIFLSSVMMTALQLVLLGGWTIHAAGIKFSWMHLRQMFSYGWPLTFANLAIFVLNFSDRFVLKHLQSLDAVGVYAVGYKFGFMINVLLVGPFLGMWQARMFIIQEHPEQRKIFRQIFVLYSLLLIYGGLGISLFSPEIMHVMVDPKFAATQRVIAPVALAYVFWGMGYYAQFGMYLTNRTRLIGTIGAGAAIVNLGLNYVLIHNFGMMGAAYATLLSFMGVSAASYFASQRVFPLPLAVGRVMAAMGIGLFIYFSSVFWNPPSLAVALAVKGLLMVAFPFLMVKLNILSLDEKNTLFAMIGNFRTGFSKAFGLA